MARPQRYPPRGSTDFHVRYHVDDMGVGALLPRMSSPRGMHRTETPPKTRHAVPMEAATELRAS